MMDTKASEFHPDRMISELHQFVKDRAEGNLKRYRVNRDEKTDIEIKKSERIRAIRENTMNMSRGAFARVMNVPVDTLRAWEIGRRSPSGAALRLLDIAEKAPQMLSPYAKAGNLSPSTKPKN